MEPSCNGCGDCCDPVPLPLTKAEARRRRLNPADRRWILYRLRRISRTEAIRRRPGLATGGSKVFYECRDFDPVGRRCTVHETKPPCCSGFPWYDGEPEPSKIDYLERCAFNSSSGVPIALGRLS